VIIPAICRLWGIIGHVPFNLSARNLRPWAAYPIRIGLWFGTRTSECWSKELRTRGDWSPLDPLC